MASRDVRSVTVIGSQAMVRPDGLASIRLETQELGAIAFVVDETAIAAIRSALVIAENHLKLSKNQTRN